MSLSEFDTRAKLIDPMLHARGWTEDLIRRAETASGLDALRMMGRHPPHYLHETKVRLFAV